MPLDRLRYALEAAGVGLWDWDIRSGDLWWSENLERIHGVPPGAFDGNFDTFRRFIHPDDLDAFDRAVRDALDSGTDFFVEFRVPGADGTVRWIRGQGRVFRDAAGDPYRMIGLGLDVTTRRDDERATLQMGVIANASHDAIVSVTMDGVVTGWNDGAMRLYGYTAQEMLGQTLVRLVPPDHASELDAIFQRLRSGERIADFQTERLTKDGRRVSVSISSGPIMDRAGRVVEAATVARDVTKQRREAGRQRLLADIGAALTSSIDTATALSATARVIVRDLADWCTVHLIEDDGNVRRAVIMHRDPARLAWARSQEAIIPFEATAAMGVPNVIQTGVSAFFPELDDADLDRRVEKADVATVLKAAELRSAIVVPLAARNTTIGALALYRQEGRRRFDEDDLSVAEELGQRVALAIENAQLFRRVAEAEKHLRLVADNLPALVSYIGSDWTYRFVNRRYEAWFGLPREELIGKRVDHLVGDRDAAMVSEYIARALSGEEVRYELSIDYPAAGHRSVEINYVPDRDEQGETRGMVALIVDVTDRRTEQRRSAGLSQLTAALARAVTERDVADCIVRHGLDAIGATAGGVAALSEDGHELTLLSTAGLPPMQSPGYRFSADAVTSFGTAVRARAPLLLSNWNERIGRLPHHAKLAMPNAMGAMAALPLVVEDRVLGSFAAIFAEERAFRPADVEFMMTVASLCAQSLERARLFDSEQRARAEAERERSRLAFLAEVSRVLAGSLDYPNDLHKIGRLLVPELAEWCSIDLIGDDGGLERVAVIHADPARKACADRLRHRFGRLRPSVGHTMWRVLADGRSWFDPDVDPVRFREEARDAEHLSVLECLGYAGEMVIPLVARGRALGALTLVRGTGAERFTETELALAEELAGRVALGIDNARLFHASVSSERRYRALYEGVADALLVVDGAGWVRGGNAAALELLGYDADALERLGLSDLVTGRANGAALDVEELASSGEVEIRRKDGSAFTADVSVSRVDLPSGPAYLVDLRDTTTKKTLERLQRDYLAMVTHDLRSPLAAIRVQAQLMRRRGAYSDEATAAIVGQTERMARLIDSLADVVRVDAGRFELNRTEFDLVALVRDVVDQELAQLPERDVMVESAGPVRGWWDADRVAQIVSNIVGNALKYGDAAFPVVVRVEDGDEPSVAVIDRGPGIAEEHLPKLFERFYRADVTGAGGLGLGLFIARMLAEAHGGRIAVESRAGEGSTFRAVLPRRARAA